MCRQSVFFRLATRSHCGQGFRGGRRVSLSASSRRFTMKLIGALLSISLLGGGCWCIVGAGSAPSSIDSGSFRCDGYHAISSEFRCDGTIDCVDGTDERKCDYDDCQKDDPDTFFCQIGRQCILPEFVCDGIDDCSDKSDELNCTSQDPCPSPFFSCADRSNCVPRSFMCDGHPECHDKSDESEETCHGTLHGYSNCKDKFKCGAGLCLEDEKLVCDGKKNCPDGRDESPETCLSHPDCKNCTQLCKRHSHGAMCGCNPGFELAEDGGSCIDVDECARGFCSQICLNSRGSFKCECRAGFKKVNETRCENLDTATFVWYRGDLRKGRYIILERDGRERKLRIPQTQADEHMPVTLMPPMAFDIDNEKLYIRVGNTLYSMHTETRRNARPALVPVLSPRVQMTDFAVDHATGNVYFTSRKGTGINICGVDGSCFPYVSRRSDIVSRIQIARLTSGTKVFWQEGSKIMSGSLDGSELHQVFKVLGGEGIRYFVIDEQSGKMYLALKNLLEFDLTTSKTKILARLDLDISGNMFWNMAVHDDVVLVQVVDAKSAVSPKSKKLVNKILKIDRLTGDHLGPLEAPEFLQLHSVRHTSKTPLQNPCSRNKCSHVCAPEASSNGYKCLCPPGMHLDDGDDHLCIPQEGEEVIFFVNGTSVSTYVFEDDELFMNSNFNLNNPPLAVATTLDMNLIVSNRHKLIERRRDGSLRTYGARGVRAMVVDPIDDVLYAANDYELLAVNLKTSSIALIRNDVHIKHMDIDPLSRTIYVETMDSELLSMEIGVWQDTVLQEVPKPSDDGQRTWAFDPSTRSIQTELSLVLERGYCDLLHDGPLGFDCHQRHGWLVQRCNHSVHGTRFLARAGPPLVPLKGSACGTSNCEFCVSANGKTLLEPVCVCPYGHELGADSKSCTKECGKETLRCVSGDKRCIHKSRRCDGYPDCSDGSDELHCNDHDCGSNFKCLKDGNCIAKRFVCDGVTDCVDGSDEDRCDKHSCSPAQFMCEGGECISRFKRCDGVPNCFHGDDEKNCTKPECKKNEFDCGNACIPQEWVCDSRSDCPNGEDEADCSSVSMKPGKKPKHDCNSKWIFCCKSGEQLPASMHCNGIDECEDRSDEANCNVTCGAPRFLCNDGACLAESEVCDGIAHCPDKADEHNCKGKCLEKDLFECRADGTCLPRDKICDGKKDCSDGADEAGDSCISSSPSPANLTCSGDEFKCHSGQCIPMYQVCDGKKQCEDGTDEGTFCRKLDCKAAGCSQSCILGGPRGVTCICDKGYRLSSDGYACDDIDECQETPEVCSQFCINEKGTYNCTCAPGFIPNAKGECRVENGDALVLIVENGVIETIDKSRDRRMVLSLPGSHVGGVEYDAATGLVFVSDTDNNKIHRIPLNKASRQYKHETYTQLKPGALAFDWVTGNLYFADHRPAIHVCNRSMAGAYCRILTEVNVKPSPGAPPPSITSIALVPDEGIMFYAEASTGFIFRQNMDGTEKSIFGWAAREKRPLSLTVDHIQRTLYWVDAHSGSIESSNLKGEKIRRVASHLSFVRTFAIFEDYLVFPEPLTENWVIMHKRTGVIRSAKRSPLGQVSEVKIIHLVNQPHEINRCTKNPCQQMCLLKPHDFACACIDGQELSKDGKTCVQASIDDSNLIDKKWEQKLQSHCSCENGGKCTASKMNADSYYCKCPAGYHGNRCESGPTGSLVLTIFLVCTFFFVVAGAGVYLMLLGAKRERFWRGIRSQEGGDRLTLIEKEAEEDFQ